MLEIFSTMEMNALVLVDMLVLVDFLFAVTFGVVHTHQTFQIL